MKKLLNLLMILVIVSTMFSGCSSGKSEVPQKSEEELKAEVKAEMEAEANLKKEMEAKIRAEMESEVKGETEGEQGTNPEKSVSADEGKSEEKKQPADNNTEDKETGNSKASDQPETEGAALIGSDKSAGYYKYKANTTVQFDIDFDGKKEEIKYDSNSGKLKITGYEAINIDTMFAQKDYFIIINFEDKFDNKINMIGIIDNGPSNDKVTTLYSIMDPINRPMGDKALVSVGSVTGEIVPPSQYKGDNIVDDPNNNAYIEDFNYKAVVIKGQGIEAPVRLSVLPHASWYGRNLFTFYTTYRLLIDNIEKYGQDYKTLMVLRIENDIKLYSEKNVSSESFVVKAGHQAYLVSTDNQQWIGMATDDGGEGWVLAKDVTDQNFSGFPVFD